MYVGNQKSLKAFDEYLINTSYSIEELINMASDVLLPYFTSYQNIALLVGPGNNGADALSLGEKLYRLGKDITFYYIGDYQNFSKGNLFYFNQCLSLNMNFINVDESTLLDFNKYDVIGDGFFGFGLNKSPRGIYKTIIEHINNDYKKDVIAIDIPTGLNCDSGKPYDDVLIATKTICLSALKEGYLNEESKIYTGEVIVEELPIKNPFKEVGLFKLIDYDFISRHLKDRIFDGYKNYYGKDLLIVGSKAYKGAAILSAKGCQYAGAGIVKVFTCKEVDNIMPIAIPEVISEVRSSPIKENFNDYNAILIGCGLSLEEESIKIVKQILIETNNPLIIDADGLNILSNHLELLENQKRPIILTPHIGEFNRLDKTEGSLSERAKAFALKYHVILVLKGPYTIVTNGEKSYRIASGNKYMSVGGMGDTLAGIITAFVGNRYSPLLATLLAVYIHGFTGDLIANDHYSVMGDKLCKTLPIAMNHILKNKS